MQLNQRVSAPRASFSGAALRTQPFTSSNVSRGSLQVTNAITRQRKEQTVTELKEKLESSHVVFGMRFKGLPVQTVQKFRKSLPEATSVMVCKNSLMKVACKDVAGWSLIADKGCEGENAWVFVKEDDIAKTVKLYFKFEEELLVEAKKVAPKNTEVKAPTSLSCAVMDNQYLTPKELKACENLPTKLELITTVARLVKTPAKQIATGIKMVPTKLAVALKLVSELDDDKTKTVASVIKA